MDRLWSPEITPTEDFYVVSKNIEGFDPEFSGESWTLTIDGLVLSLSGLQAMPVTTGFNTLMSISYRVGGELISNAS